MNRPPFFGTLAGTRWFRSVHRLSSLQSLKMPARQHIEQMMKKLQRLPPERVTEVEDFIDFLNHRDEDRGLVQAAQKISESTLHTVWDNPADADYDRV